MASKTFSLSKVYGLLEPGPVVMVTTARDHPPCDLPRKSPLPISTPLCRRML